MYYFIHCIMLDFLEQFFKRMFLIIIIRILFLIIKLSFIQ